MKKNKKNCYEFGSFVQANQANIGAVGQMGAGILEGFKNPNKANTGLTIGQGVLSGASAGAALGPLGMAGGALIGGIAGAVSAGKQKRAIEGQRNQLYGDLQGQAMGGMNTANINPYGTQIYQDGSYVTSNIDPRKPKPYQPNIMLPGWDGMVQKADGSVGMWGNPLDSTRVKQPVLPVLPLGQTDHRGQLSGQKYQGTPATTNQILMKEKLLRAQSSKNYYANGGDIDQNIINIEAGELQIDPVTGKILRKFKGINPETSGLYKAHNEKGKDTTNNFVTAEPGTFIVTKKKAKKYEDAVENNDKLAQETILQNIRNYKSEVKGDKLKFAYGADVPFAKMAGVNQGAGFALNTLNPNYQALGQAQMVNPFAPKPIIPMTQSAGVNQMNNPMFYNNYVQGPLNQVGQAKMAGVTQLEENNIIYSSPKNLSNKLDQTTSYTPSGVQGSGFSNGLSKGLGALAQYGPAAMNIGRGLFGQVEQQARMTPNQNPYLNQIQANMPQDINMQPIYNDIYSQGRTATNDIRNNSNSSAVFRANRQNIGANSQRQIAGARLQGDMANNQIRGQRASIYSNLGAQSMQEQARVQGLNMGIDQTNAQNRAAKSDILGTGISQLQQVYQNNKYNGQMYNAEMYKANLLPQIFELSKFYPNLLEDLKKLKGN